MTQTFDGFSFFVTSVLVEPATWMAAVVAVVETGAVYAECHTITVGRSYLCPDDVVVNDDVNCQTACHLQTISVDSTQYSRTIQHAI